VTEIDRERDTGSDSRSDTGETVAEGARTVGRLLLWIVIGVCVVALAVGLLLLGPLGIIILVPALLVIWAAAAVTAGGPAAGA
jgi:hypothetical protein